MLKRISMVFVITVLVIGLAGCGRKHDAVFVLNGKQVDRKSVDAFGLIYVSEHGLVEKDMLDEVYENGETYEEHYKNELEKEIVLAVLLGKEADDHKITLEKDEKKKDLSCVGRLDKDTTGLMIITNDGELAHKMLSPKSHVYKLYEAEVDRALTSDDVRSFADGIKCGELEFLPAAMKITGEKRALVEICEGKFHQVKKMFHAVGAEVTALKRLRIGGMFLDENLAPGECRELTKNEINDIISLTHGI